MKTRHKKTLNICSHFFLNYIYGMIHTLVKIKFLKLALLGAFGAGVLATLIAKEVRNKKKTEDTDD